MSRSSKWPESLAGGRERPAPEKRPTVEQVPESKDVERENEWTPRRRKVVKEDMFGNKYFDYP